MPEILGQFPPRQSTEVQKCGNQIDICKEDCAASTEGCSDPHRTPELQGAMALAAASRCEGPIGHI